MLVCFGIMVPLQVYMHDRAAEGVNQPQAVGHVTQHLTTDFLLVLNLESSGFGRGFSGPRASSEILGVGSDNATMLKKFVGYACVCVAIDEKGCRSRAFAESHCHAFTLSMTPRPTNVRHRCGTRALS